MLDDLKSWYAKPFDPDMSAGKWFLFFGFLIAVAAGWRIILHHIEV